ncbi:MAG: hypothetical protein A2Z20_05935 [Bdellovibrionales bacterium RBG_16_40_8]|nr:MAG: hypothetical protein A2Z20_05935 [Bdellovibrionales bacterium RBG_16_40_8]
MRIFGCTAFAFMAAWAAPTQVQSIDFRTINPSSPITINRASPAFYALEDSRKEYQLEKKQLNNSTDAVAETLILGQARKISQNHIQPLKLRPTIITQEIKQDGFTRLIAEALKESQPQTAVEMADILVKDELARRQNENKTGIKTLVTSSGKTITVALTNAKNTNKSIIENTSQNKKEISSLISTSNPARYVISGPITFSGGAAFLGKRENIKTHQLIDGLAISEASINLKDANYEILVDKLEGQLFTEVRSEDGQVIAQGSVNLYELNRSKISVARIKNIPIEVRPIFNGATGVIISAASQGKIQYPIADAKIFVANLDREIIKNKETGEFEDETLAMPSNYLVRAEHQRFWPSLGYVKSGEKFSLRLFPEGLIKALLGLSLDKYEARDAENDAIIWGRITFGGNPVEGAQVSIVGNIENKPVYFTGLLPDKTRTATSNTGEFAFTRVQEEEAILYVTLNGMAPLPAFIPTAKRHVAYADLKITPSQEIEIVSYEAFIGEPREAIMQPMGTQEQIFIPDNGILRRSFYTIQGLTFLEADAGQEFSPVRIAFDSNATELHFSHLRNDWLKKLRESKNIPAKPNNTTVVGFVGGENFDVLLGAGYEEVSSRIVYFNATGEIISGRGQAGGGFAILDLPQGIHTITIVPEKSKKVVTQTAYVDEYAVQLLNVNLMF